MIITIGGKPGSGKTTVAKELAKRLGFKHYSGGDMRGELATEHGMTIDELNEVAKTKDWTDKLIDEKVERIGKTEDDIVFDSWTAFHFIPHSVKIFFDVDLKVAAERIFKNQRTDEAHHDTVEEVYDMISHRLKIRVVTYERLYGFNMVDLSNYDLVVDTTNIDIEGAVNKVLDFLKTKGLKID